MERNELPFDENNTTVHQALAAATLQSKSTVKMKNFSVRLPDGLKKQAQEICAIHQTDLGSYLRKCAQALVSDYGHKVEE
jgi:hypothetical protein